MKLRHFKLVVLAFLAVMTVAGCQKESFKVYAWLSGKVDMPEEELENYFKKAAESGIDGLLIECHGGYPVILQDSASFRDSAALTILRNAAVYAKKYDVELHAWMWTTNRCEKNLREAHPDWYQVNGLGQNISTDVNLYGREHYRFLCPSRKEVIDYLKDRVRELAEVDGLAGIHLDFIRYPDAILPYGLHESRGVVQDKVYPLWDCCYCDSCRAAFKAIAGIDPIELEDPTADSQWMQFRWDGIAEMASELCAEIHKCGKISSAAVFASPDESKKLVRQDWANFRDIDYIFPMIYHHSYAKPDEWVGTATAEGIKALEESGNPAALYSGIMMPEAEDIPMFVQLVKDAGGKGICFFELKRTNRHPELWDAIAAIDRTIN